MVSTTHRFLRGQRPGDATSGPVWVLYGSGVGDLIYHDLYHGVVELRRTVELWGLEEWADPGEPPPIVVRLKSTGDLGFEGNVDPEAARAQFDRMRGRRAPRYGSRRSRSSERPDSTQEGSQAAASAADGARRQAGGTGVALVNTMEQIATALECQTGERILVVVERFAEQMDALGASNLEAYHAAMRVLAERWLTTPSQRHAKLVFIALIRAQIEKLIPRDLDVKWIEIPGPSAEEITEVLLRASRRHGFRVRQAEAVGKALQNYGQLRNALGNVARIRMREEEVQLDKVLDLPPINEAAVESILAELDELVGLAQVKDKVRALVLSARARRRRLEDTGLFPDETMHMIFSGPAGTGKTTVARIVARLYNALGLLPEDVVTEAAVSQGILSPVVNQTQENLHRLLEENLGGVVFLDEVHVLADEEGSGAEAVRALVPMTWNHRNRLVVILAGYSDRMHDVLKMDQGLPRRFPEYGRLEFTPYTADELWEILRRKLARDQWQLQPEAETPLRRLLRRRAAKSTFGNAGGVDNLVNEMVERHSARHGEPGVFTVDDVPPSLVRRDREYAEAQAELNSLVGLQDARRVLDDVIERVAYALEEGEDVEAPNMLFVGPPGTGKTTVARLLGQMLYGIGVLERNSLLEAGRPDFVAEYQGQTANRTRATVEKARGGVLFLDEAYSLVTGDYDSFGKEALAELLRQITYPDNRDTVFVLAGYPDEIDELLAQNPGTERRFERKVEFNNFSPEDCAEVARLVMESNNQTWEDGFLEAFAEQAQVAIDGSGRSFGNAGWARTALGSAETCMIRRVRREGIPAGDPGRRHLLTSDLREALGTQGDAQHEAAGTGGEASAG